MPYQYKREPLTSDEADRLVNAAESFEEKLVVFTLLDTGLRVAEFATLTTENVQWQERRLVIYGKGGPYGKKSKRRVIPITDRVRTLLEHLFSIRNDVGMTPRTVQRMVKRIANRANITKPVTPHVLRHTFATICLRKNMGLRTLQALLGHDRIGTTEIYMNVSPEDVVKEFREKW